MSRDGDDMHDEVSREEIISNLQQFQDNLKSSLSNKSLQIKALIGGASSLGILSSFLLGRKSGKKRKSAEEPDDQK